MRVEESGRVEQNHLDVAASENPGRPDLESLRLRTDNAQLLSDLGG